jgi:cytochrome c oxidase subunit I+III
VLLFLLDAARTLRRPPRPATDPWGGATLEWIPAGSYGTRSIPQVQSREPLWQQPGLAAEVMAGAHWLPGSAFGGRETLVTSPVQARLRHLVRLPGDSWLPVVAALGTAGFFLLLTVKWSVPAWTSGAVAVAAVLMWLWQTDRPPPAALARVGEGVELPVGGAGRAAHAWWAAVVLVAVDTSIFASLLFAHLHVAMQAAQCPPPGAALPEADGSLLAVLLYVAAGAAMGAAVRVHRRGHRVAWLRAALVLALTALAGGFAAQWWGLMAAGLDPRAQAWSATVAALLGLQGLHVLLLGVMGAYVLARSVAGLLHARASALDVTALLWYCICAQGVVLAGVVNLLPGWLG